METKKMKNEDVDYIIIPRILKYPETIKGKSLRFDDFDEKLKQLKNIGYELVVLIEEINNNYAWDDTYNLGDSRRKNPKYIMEKSFQDDSAKESTKKYNKLVDKWNKIIADLQFKKIPYLPQQIEVDSESNY